MKLSHQLRAILCVAFAGLTALTARDARAAQSAYDNASSAVYTGSSWQNSWTNSMNGGTGFAAWSMVTVGGGTNVLTNSICYNSGSYAPGVNSTNGKAWGLNAGGNTTNSNYAFATRSFTAGTTPNATLQSNQTFTIDYQLNGGVDGSGGVMGFALVGSGGQTNFFLQSIQGTSAFETNGTGHIPSPGYINNGMRCAFTLTSTNTYSLVLTVPTNAATGVYTYNGTLLTNTPITAVRLFANGSGTAANNNGICNQYADYDFFNNMGISCPTNTTITGPASTSVCLSTPNASFFISTTNASAPIYQWLKIVGATTNAVINGGTISGANTTNLVLTGVVSGDSGSAWACAITNACGTVTNSVAASLTVVSSVSITNQPSGATACSGGSASFTVGAAGATSYQWYEGPTGSGTLLNNSGTISGATTATLALSGSGVNTTTNFYVIVSGCGSPVTSSGATLTITTTPSISGQPTAQSACAAGNATFSVTGSGGGLNYTWNRIGWGPGDGWAFTTGAGSLNVSSSGSTTIDTNSLSWFLGNSSSSSGTKAIRSFPAALTNGQQFQIDMLNNGVTTVAGFSLLNASTNVVWTWEYAGGNNYVYIDNSGTHAPSGEGYETSGQIITFTMTSANTYSAIVSNLNNSTGYPFSGTLLNPTGGSLPAMVSLFNTNAGGNLYFNKMIVAGSAFDSALGYTTISGNAGWQFVSGTGSSAFTNLNGGYAPLTNGGTISGETASSLTLTGVASTDSNSAFYVVVSNACGTINSSTNALTVNASPTITTTSLPGGTTATPYSQTVSATGGTTWSISSGTLPLGLTINSSNGLISGTPTNAGTSSFTVQVAGVNGCTASQPLSITISCATITVSSPVSSTLPTANSGQAYSQAFGATGGTNSYVWSISAGVIPGGMTLSSAGVLSGNSPTNGSYSFTVQATDADGCSGTKGYTLAVATCSTITLSPNGANPTVLTTGTVAVSYNQSITASGGTGPYTYSLFSGTLPSGLTISSGGLISGSPTNSGTSTFTVLATDTSTGCTGTQNYSLTIKCPTLTLLPAAGALTAGTSGIAYSNSFSASGGNNSFTYSKTAGGLPTGLTLVSSSGVLSGTPSGSGSNYSFTVTAMDSSGCLIAQAYTLQISCPTITVNPTNLPNRLVNAAYSTNISATGSAVGSYTFTNSAGALPTGLTLSSSGVLSGTPTVTNTYNFTIMATDANGCTGSRAYTVVVGSAPSVTTQPTSTAVCSGTNVSFSVTGGGTAPLNYAWNRVGWGPANGWTFTAGGGGLFVGSSTIAGASPGINTNGLAWGLLNTTAPATTALRSFPAPLSVGQQFQIQIQINNVQAPGGVGFSLLNASGNSVWAFEWIGQGSGYSIVDSSGTNATTAAYTTGGSEVIFTLASATTYSVTVSNFSGGATYGPFTGTLLSPTGGSAPAKVNLFNANANNNNINFNLYFNSIVVAGSAFDSASGYSTVTGNAGWQYVSGNFTNLNGGSAPFTNGGTISGETTSNLTLTGVTTADSNSAFYAVISNAYGTAQSSNATLSVNASPAITTASPLPNATVNSNYTDTVTASGGTGPYTFTNSAGSLPAGLTMNSSGVISGTPTAIGTSSFTVMVTDSSALHCPGTSNLTLTVVCPVITVSPQVLANVSIGAAYDQMVSAIGGQAPYTYSITAGSLPTGLSLSNTTGVISGTYNGSTGTNMFTVTATDALGCTGQTSYTVTETPCAPVTITTASLPNGTAGTVYNQQVSATGGTTPYTWSISVGTLPAGLSINSTNGIISGTPTAASSSTFTVLATDQNGCTGPKTYSVTIGCPTITFSTSDPLTAGTVGTAYSQTITASGGTSPYTYAKASGALPAGLTLSTGGVLSGTPSLAGTYTFAVAATDVYSCASAAMTYHVTINCVTTITVTPSTLPNLLVNAAYSTNILATGSAATPYTFSVSSGTLPTGLALTSTNGVLSGTPTVTNTYNFTVAATDTNGCSGSQAYTVVVGGPPAVTTQPTAETACAGGNATFSVTGGGTAPLGYAWRKRGTGWGSGNAWALTAGSGSLFIGSSTGNGSAAGTTNIDTSGQSWGMMNSTASSTTTAIRSFPAALQVGQQFQIDMDNGYIDSPNTVGFSLLNASGNIVWELYIGGLTPYQIHDLNNGSLTTGAAYTETGVRVVFTLTSATTYSATVKNIATGTTYGPTTGTLLSPAGGSVPAQVRLYDAAGNSGSNWQLYFNSMIVAGVVDDNAAAYTGTTWAGGQTPNLGNVPLTNGGTVSGSGTSGLTLTGVSTNDNGALFDVVLTNAYGYAQSSAAALTVLALPTATASGTAAICANSSTAISAALAGTGPWYLTWNDGFTQTTNSSPATRTVSPITNYTYTVTVVSNTTCTGSSSGSAAITVHPLPTATVSGSTTVCPGNSANIQAALTGTGPWNITWLDGSTNFTQNGVASSPAVRSVSPASTTTYTVTSVSDANCTGTSSGSAVITVSASPSVTASDNAPFFEGQYQIVQGQTLQLSASSVSGAISYNWTRDGGATFATTQNATDIPPSGTHTYTVTVPTSCGTAMGSTPNIVVLTADASGVPDSWKTAHGYAASTPSSTVGANGFTLLQSYEAGLNPTNAASVLDMSSASVTPSGTMTVTWQSAQDGTTPTRLYDFYSLTAPYTNGGSWSRIDSNIAPAGATTSQSDDVAGVSQRFYRATIAGHTDDVATIGIAGVQMLTLEEGANYISMSTTQATPTLLSVLGTNLPQGAFESTATTVDIWNQASQEFLVNNARYWLDTGTNGWIQHNTTLASNNVQLDPTKGFIVTIPAGHGPQTLYVPGFVPTVAEAQTVQSNGYTVASSTYPQPITLTGSGLSNSVTGGISLNKSDNLLFFDPTTQLFDIRVWYYTGDESWRNADASIATQQLEPGGAFLIERRSRSTNLIWTNPVPYQVPLQGP